MAESNIQRALDDVVEFIRALPGNCDDLLECREAVERSVREAAPAFVRHQPILLTLFAARTSEQVIDVLVELAIRSRCPGMYLTPLENSQLTEAGLSFHEQLLLGRLRERLNDEEESH